MISWLLLIFSVFVPNSHLQRMHAEGHQIASHTWSHENASQMTNTQFTNQMIWNEIAINSILGFFPTYMR
jgi:peptidoglycan/xylan/chitin deacetylase (PgdA/CDA1 family)